MQLNISVEAKQLEVYNIIKQQVQKFSKIPQIH